MELSMRFFSNDYGAAFPMMLASAHVFVLVWVRACYGIDSWVCSANTDAFVTSAQHVETEKRLHALETQVQQLQQLLQQKDSSTFSVINGIPRDCQEIYENGTKQDGVYSVSPDGRCPFVVYCDMTNGGWTVIQKRVDDKVSFYRDWNDYVAGFGDLDSSYWLGLEKIHRLTRDGVQIYFHIENYDGSQEYAHYQVFSVQGAATAYTMYVDAFGYKGSINELFSYHNGMKFTTYDRDNDASSKACISNLGGGAWWYNSCWRLGNVNGVYGKKDSEGIAYYDGKTIPVKSVQIWVKRMLGTCENI